MKRAVTFAAMASLCLLGKPVPARADVAQYQHLVTCAAYHQLAYALYSQGEQAKTHKAEIKYHKHEVALLMELAGSLLDPYHVPPARVRADSVTVYQGLIERARQGESFEHLMAEAEDTCHDMAIGE